jgi:hypothetical protein
MQKHDEKTNFCDVSKKWGVAKHLGKKKVGICE